MFTMKSLQRREHPITAELYFMKHFWLILAVIVLTVGLRVARSQLQEYMSRDTYSYIEAARQISETNDWRPIFEQERYSNMPPGYLWYLTTACRWGVDPVLAGLFLTISASVFLVLAMYISVYELSRSFTAALFAAVLVATDPLLVKLCSRMLREIPYFACVMCAFTAGLVAIRRKKYFLFLAYVPFSVGALLLRKEGIEVLMIPAFMPLFVIPSTIRMHAWKKWLIICGCCIMVVLMSLALISPIERYFVTRWGSAWEVIPRTWAGYIWTMFRRLL